MLALSQLNRDVLRTLREHLRPLIAYHLFFTLLASLLLLPAVAWTLTHLLARFGRTVITNAELVDILMSAGGALWLLAVVPHLPGALPAAGGDDPGGGPAPGQPSAPRLRGALVDPAPPAPAGGPGGGPGGRPPAAGHSGGVCHHLALRRLPGRTRPLLCAAGPAAGALAVPGHRPGTARAPAAGPAAHSRGRVRPGRRRRARRWQTPPE